MKTEFAILADGTRKPYIKVDNPPHGGMKHTYFAPDRSYVVQFFNNQYAGLNPDLLERLEAIIGRYNPTLPEANGGAMGNTEASADYFSGRFCWPTAIVTSPELGIMCPVYPDRFFFTKRASKFADLDVRNQDKRSNWFTGSAREKLQREELGDFRSMLRIAILLVRTVRRMHQAGLAHSDLSCNNVLIDPVSGDCVVIDIDSLVVPGLYPPEVIGTPGYIAPEVLTAAYSDDPRRFPPNMLTDLHSLAVLIYQYLLLRHPLWGPKVHSTESEGLDGFLRFGPEALFIENPHDDSNRPPDLKVTIKDLGPFLETMFLRSFVNGLHVREERPSALEWERALAHTWDLLHPCSNVDCEQGWFIHHDDKLVCPFCGTKVSTREFIKLTLLSELRGREGHWKVSGEMIVTDKTSILKWHMFSHVFPDEKADDTVQATIYGRSGKWILVNENIVGLVSPTGKVVPIGQACTLEEGMVMRLSKQKNSQLLKVSLIQAP